MTGTDGDSAQSGAYVAAGVDYAVLDAGKREAIAAALATSGLAAAHGGRVDDATRGEPAFVMTLGELKLALVMECLGTKSSIAVEHQRVSGENRFEWTGFDAVAAIVNDLCSTGALPAIVNAYFATGSASWYHAEGRFSALVRGWQQACVESRAVWGGGESPMLAGIVVEDELDLAGCAVGYLPADRDPLVGSRIRAGDEIVLVASSGLHTNGATLARAAAERLGGLKTTIANGSTFGDAVLWPSRIYVDLIAALYAAGTPLNYASHITGHGLRKLMRPNRDFTYRIDRLLPSLPVFDAIVETMALTPSEAFGTFNMGNGFALYVPAGVGEAASKVARTAGYDAHVGGVVEEGPRQVVLSEVGVVFDSDELRLR